MRGFILLFFACWGGAPELPVQGEWGLRGEGVVGHLVARKECSIELHGRRFGTPGGEAVECSMTMDGEEPWVTFPIVTGVGEGVGTMRLDVAGGAATLPLGSREGEWESSIELVAGGVGREALEEARGSSVRQLGEIARGWETGELLLKRGGAVVGELRMPGDGSVSLQLFDETWMTRGRVDAEVQFMGPDMFLSFAVMPALQGELGGLIVNRVLGEAVAPLGPEVTPVDRSFEVEAGRLEESERTRLVEVALAAGLERERAVTLRLARELFMESGAAAVSLEQCTSLAVSEEWIERLSGYDLGFEPWEGECSLWLEPTISQHLRRVALRVNSEKLDELAKPL